MIKNKELLEKVEEELKRFSEALEEIDKKFDVIDGQECKDEDVAEVVGDLLTEEIDLDQLEETRSEIEEDLFAFNDISETLSSGRQLDPTQESFLISFGLIERED